VSISVGQGNMGRIAILSTSNNVTIVVANFSSTTSQSPTLTFSYNITLQCSAVNSSQMQLQPGTDVLMAYCYSQSYLFEYVISNTDYFQLRLLPLYVFYTATFANFTNTDNYYFVPVTLNGTMPPYVSGNQYWLAMCFGSLSSSAINKIVNTCDPIILVGGMLDTIMYPVGGGFAMLMAFST